VRIISCLLRWAETRDTLCLVSAAIVVCMLSACDKDDAALDSGSVRNDVVWRTLNVNCSLGAMWGLGQDVVSVGSGNLSGIRDGKITNLHFPFVIFEGNLSNQVFGLSTGEIYVSGGTSFPRREFGEVWCWSAGNWRAMEVGADSPIRGVWGTSDSSLVTVGDGGAVYRYDGHSWHSQDAGTQVNLHAICGWSDSDLVAVGDSGLILYSHGDVWEQAHSPVGASLRAICSFASDSFCVVGDSGTVLVGADSDWAVVNAAVSYNLNQVRPSGDGALYIAGDSGTVLHYQDGNWQSLTREYGDRNLRGIWPTDNQSVLAASREGFLLEIMRDTAIVHNLGVYVRSQSIWGPTPSEIYLAAGGLYLLSGDHFRAVEDVLNRYCRAKVVVGTGVGGTGLFVGGAYGDPTSPQIDAFLVQGNGVLWSSILVIPFATCTDIWPISTTDAYATLVGRGLLHYDGQGWDWVDELIGMPLRSVWASATDNVFAVGDSGLVAHYDGETWSVDTVQPVEKLMKVRGTLSRAVAAVGADGTAFFYNGSDWISSHTGASDTLRDLWGTSPVNLHVVGDNGIILKFDGREWHTFVTGGEEDLLSIWGFGPEDMIVGGSDGILLRSQ